jgi:Ni,Fe-hydrogenase III large subunit
VTTTRASGAEIFRDRVAEACADGVPLGAYADDHALHYLFLAAQGPYALSHRFDETRIAKAVSGACPALAWDEREMAQERAVHFEDLPDPRPFRWHDGAMPPAVVAHGSGLMHFVVGPVHAGIIEPGRFTFSSGGETLVHLDAQLGYSYRGVERALEGGSAAASAPKVARICGGCSASHSFGYALALEALAGVRVCAEVDLARLVIAELERIYNHVADLAASSAGTGWGVGFARGMALKEEAMRLCAIAGGHRLLFDAVVPGGVAAFALDDRRRIAVEVVKLESHSERFVHALFGNASVSSRWQNAGVLGREIAHALGAVGPAHRASHGTVDVRTFAPYGAYRDLPARVARATGGDAMARCHVKRDELSESFRLIREALALLGDAALPPPLALRAGTGTALATVEGPRGAETIALRIGAGGRLERFHLISASYRNWPCVARAMDDNIVPDFPLVNKSFNLCYACADR